MKRREFILSSGTFAAVAGAFPAMAFRKGRNQEFPEGVQSYLLKGFKDEQEEYPSLVTNDKGDMWMFSLRRLKYPLDKELVSAFRYDGENWSEVSPVTTDEGQYEAPTADCHSDGTPVVAWSSIESGQWVINVTEYDGNPVSKPHQFRSESGKPINPVLLASGPNKNWLAWENYDQGKFSIFISKFDHGRWSDPIEISKGEHSCFEPALAEDQNGDLFVAYGLTDGYHQNIEMTLLDGGSMQVKETIPVAIGGAFKNRINLNTKPAITFGPDNRLWISYENNRDASRLDDADCFTGDRICAMVSYEDGKIVEPANSGRWLFSGKNDHKPTFFRDGNGHLYAATHCGGDFEGNPFWQYRISWLDPEEGWVKPVTILQSKQKGGLIPPAIAFDKNNHLWLSTLTQKTFKYENPDEHEGVVQSHLTQLNVFRYPAPELNQGFRSQKFTESVVEEFHENRDYVPEVSGHPRIKGEIIDADGTKYALLNGNLHEHSENSPCWPAGTDGTLHDDYRFGLFSEHFDFMAITDHGYSLNEVYWRKNIRLADFYNDPPYFVALPAMEWTLSARRDLESTFGAGHYNVIFGSSDEARKFIRNSQEVYNVNTPESENSVLLWDLLHKNQVDCITIPHHPADEVHPVDWNVHDDHYVPIVELFQCRGNAEYPGCPRMINLDRHRPTDSRRAFVDYALKDRKYKMGFIASGDHNGLGVGAASLWVNDFTRDDILNAMRNRRCFATTGDRMIVDFRLNGTLAGSINKTPGTPDLYFKIKGQRELEKVEVLRNSEVIREFTVGEQATELEEVFTDDGFSPGNEVNYYYVRATQKNGELAWSSPIWVEQG